MASIVVDRIVRVWGPRRGGCVLCRALWKLLPGASPVMVPDEVAQHAVAAGAARRVDPVMGDPDA